MNRFGNQFQIILLQYIRKSKLSVKSSNSSFGKVAIVIALLSVTALMHKFLIIVNKNSVELGSVS